MAINRIPGVGPQNSDVASAVAAVVPTNSSIAAAVPTNTSIANAVAAAVPTNTSIANAVAAAVPTNSNIANAVAAAVPTNASITNIVQSFSAGPTTFNRVAILTNSQTWNHPDGASANNARRVQVLVVGGGGGGGAGTAGGWNTAMFAGGSGGGSGYVRFAQTYVTGSVSVVVGAGGNGGGGYSVSGSDAQTYYGSNSYALYGNDGNNGGYSAFGNISAGGGFYGSGTMSPSTGYISGTSTGTISTPSNHFTWTRAFENSTSRMWASRGGSGGGYATGKSYGSSTMGNFGNISGSGYIQPNSTNINYPISFFPNAFPFGGSFGNHAGYTRFDANLSTPPLVFDDIYGSQPITPASLTNTYDATHTHPAFYGWGINTQSQISIASSTANANTWNSMYVQNVRDVQSFDSQFQSGGGSAGWGVTGNTTSANGIPGGLGLLGSGGSGGNSQTLQRGSAGNRSAGNGGAATGYGGGGGGGSSAGSAYTNDICTAGNGGAGSPGVVVVYY